MKKSFALVVLAVLAMPVYAQSSPEDKADKEQADRAAQESKLKNCNAEVKRQSVKTEDYRKFMRGCLSQ